MPGSEPPPPSAASPRSLPASVEAWWVERAREATGGRPAEQALRALAPEVQRLSDGFTCARPARFGDYSKTPAERAAYGLFYFPQAWVRTRLPLEEARVVRGWSPPGRAPLRILDVGAGSGAAGLAAASLLAERPGGAEVALTALDHAPEALTALARLAREAFPPGARPAVTTLGADARTPGGWPRAAEGPFDLVLVSLVLNELFAVGEDAAACAWLETLAARLTPEGLLLVVEPGTQEAAGRLVRVGADVIEKTGLHAWGPQLHAGPWRPHRSRRTWTHEVRRWNPPPSLALVNRTLWRSIGELTYSYSLLGRVAPPAFEASPRIHRLCSPVRKIKGRLTWLGLGADGRLAEFEVQERDLAREERPRFLAFERGDVLEAAELKPLGRPDAWRLPAAASLRRHLHPPRGRE